MGEFKMWISQSGELLGPDSKGTPLTGDENGVEEMRDISELLI